MKGTDERVKSGTGAKLLGGIFNLRSNSGVSCDVDQKGGRFVMIRPAETSL
jgi:hypothetical protein